MLRMQLLILATLVSQAICSTISQEQNVGLEKRVFNGRTAERGEFPYQVSLSIGMVGMCGGSLIHPSWVLTAAHCIKSNNILVQLGTANLWQWWSTVYRRSAEAIVHEHFNSSSLENDIALIKLDSPVPINQYVDVIDLPTYASDPSSLNWNLVCVSGWGSTLNQEISTSLQSSLIRLMGHDECRIKLKQQIPPSQVCSDKSFSYSGACQRDSGGPLADCRRSCSCSAGAKLVGLVSYATSYKCGTTIPEVYTNVAYYRDWIRAKAGV